MDTLAELLDRGTVALLVLDGRAKEPPGAATYRLAGWLGVIVTPHIGATSPEAVNDLLLFGRKSVCDLLMAGGRLDTAAVAP